jgi:hypothetical protein
MYNSDDCHSFPLSDKPARRKYYLIDYENVHIQGFEGMDDLTPDDRLIVFYTSNSNTIPIEFYTPLTDCQAEKQFIPVACGQPNALDFQLSSYLGFLVSNDPDAEYYIISNDKGFNSLYKFWFRRGIIIDQLSAINGESNLIRDIDPTKSITDDMSEEERFYTVMEALGMSDNDIKTMKRIIRKAQGQSKFSKKLTTLRELIASNFSSDRQTSYYTAARPFIK